MNIMELDEAEGLTREMLTAYLIRNGYSAVAYHATPEHFQKRVGRVLYQINTLKFDRSVQLLATWAKVSPQAILRAMNPRMRKGIPLKAAWEAHGKETGFWLALTDAPRDRLGETFGWFEKRPFVTRLRLFDGCWEWGIRGAGFAYGDDGKWGERADDWSFWPCDAHGNKVPWPAVSDAT